MQMAKPAHDWYLREWLKALGLKPKDIVADLEWNKAKVSLLVNLKQKYTRDEVNDLSTYLHLRPYELLMHPEEAMSLRGLRENAIKIVATTPDQDGGQNEISRDGTTG